MGVISALVITTATSYILPDFKQFIVSNFIDGTGEMFLFLAATLLTWDVVINTDDDTPGLVDIGGIVVSAAALKVIADEVRA